MPLTCTESSRISNRPSSPSLSLQGPLLPPTFLPSLETTGHLSDSCACRLCQCYARAIIFIDNHNW
jgi:hypothetical protein